MTRRLCRLLPTFFLLFVTVSPAFGAGQPANSRVVLVPNGRTHPRKPGDK